MLDIDGRIKCRRVVKIMVKNSTDDVFKEVGSNDNVKINNFYI